MAAICCMWVGPLFRVWASSTGVSSSGGDGFAVMFKHVGFDHVDPPFWDSLVYTAQSAISLESKNVRLMNRLSQAGEVLRVVVRLTGPRSSRPGPAVCPKPRKAIAGCRYQSPTHRMAGHDAFVASDHPDMPRHRHTIRCRTGIVVVDPSRPSSSPAARLPDRLRQPTPTVKRIEGAGTFGARLQRPAPSEGWRLSARTTGEGPSRGGGIRTSSCLGPTSEVTRGRLL
jgi:hypothetical protein